MKNGWKRRLGAGLLMMLLLGAVLASAAGFPEAASGLLTAAGQQRANLLGIRIEFFRRLLTDAGVHPDLALQDAISFSWKMSEDSFEAFRSMETGLIPGRNPCR